MFDEDTNELPERVVETHSLTTETVCLVDSREQMIYLGTATTETDELEPFEEGTISSSDSLWA